MAAFAVVLGGAAGAALYKLLKKPAGGGSSVPASSSPNGITAGSAQPATSSAVAQRVAGISTGVAPGAVPCRSCGANPSMAAASPAPVAPAPNQSPTSPSSITSIVSGVSSDSFTRIRSFF